MQSLLHTPGNYANTDKGEQLFFSGYSYLGMVSHTAFMQWVKEGLDKYGLMQPSARISNTPLQVYSEVESQISSWLFAGDTVLFAGGFAAGQAAVQHVQQLDCPIFAAPNCHPAVLAASIQSATTSFETWSQHVVEQIHNHPHHGPFVIIADAVNPLAPVAYDWQFLSAIQKPLIVLIDDSHGIGITGNNGKGVASLLPQQKNLEWIISFSMSKALGVQAGAVACSNASTAAALRSNPFYAATTPPMPAMLHAWQQANKLYEAQRAKLQQHYNWIKEQMQHTPSFVLHPQLPILFLPTEMDEHWFAQHNILISSFAYPNPAGMPLNRAVFTAAHSLQDVQQLTAVLRA
ncbi:hypothetical protein [Phnomibacter sp. MR]|uniref:hypothetical protein n=1 Tax=Phnomibacter sp. MR TaxID=3042318 RepID=UPI003A8112C3